MRIQISCLILGCFTAISTTCFADVYPFEEEYAATTQEMALPAAPATQVQEPAVSETETPSLDTTTPSSYSTYRTLTWRNFPRVCLNLVKGVGEVYKNLFTKGVPEYGADLVSIPEGTASLAGKFVELERQEFFERDAKEKDIQAYVEAKQKPLTPEEQKLLNALRGKPISSSSK